MTVSSKGNLHQPPVAVCNQLPQIRTPLASDGNSLWKQFPHVKTLGSFGTSLLVHLVVLVVLALATLSILGNSEHVIEMSFGAFREKENPASKNTVIGLPKTDAPVETNIEPSPRQTPVEETPAPVDKVVPKRKPHPLARRADRLFSESGIDRFGNLTGKGYGLGRDGEFAGSRILVWGYFWQIISEVFNDDNPLWAALRRKGFEITIRTGKFNPKWLQEADQLWMFSGKESQMKEEDYKAVLSFVREGHGFYLLTDNVPFIVEANALAKRMFFTTVAGDYLGKKIIAVQGRGMTHNDFLDYQRYQQARDRERENGSSPIREPNSKSSQRAILSVIAKTSHYVDDHPLLTDVNFIFEGRTISHLEQASLLESVLIASDGQVLAAVSRDTSQRIVVDCGCTRYFSNTERFITETAGTLRFAENIAAYLAGKDSKEGNTNRWRTRKQLLAEFRGKDRADLLAALQHADAERRWAAVSVASARRLNEPSLFIQRLRDPANEVRRQAWCALVRLAEGNDLGQTESADSAETDRVVLRWKQWQRAHKIDSGRDEKAAEVKLRLAKLLLKNSRDAALQRLREIVNLYPKTDAAKEASRLLLK